MSLLGGIISGAMQGVGDAGQQITQQNAKLMDEQTLMQQRSDLELQKQKAILQATEDIKNAPLKRLSDSAQQFANQDIPAAPAPVDSLSADSAINVGLQDGIQGDKAVIGKLIVDAQNTLKNPGSTPDQKEAAQGVIDQMSSQAVAQSGINIAAVAGKTRKMTPQEALDAASQKLMTNDPQAYAAYKALVGDKYVPIPDGGLLNIRTNEVIQPETTKSARAEQHDLRIERMREEHDTRAAAQQERMKRLELDPLGLNGGGVGSSSGSPTSGAGQAIASGATGDELLQAIPNTLAAQVKALSEGRMAFPAGFALKSPYWQQMMTLVSQYDPSFDAVNYNARAATRKDFTSGKSATSINAINTVMQHLNDYLEAGKALDNSSLKMWNTIGNKALDATGDPRITRFNTARNAVVDEVERAYRGSGGSQAGIEAWKENMSSSQSPAQILASGKELIHLLEGKMEALGDQYSKGMGIAKNGLELLSPKAQAVYNNVMGIRAQNTMQTSANALPAGFVLDK